MTVRNQIIGFLSLLCVLAVVLFTLSYCNARRDNARLKTEGRIAEGQANVAKSSAVVVDQNERKADAAQDLTRKNTANIQDAPDANNDAGEAGRRGVAAWCARERMRGRQPSQCA